MILLEEYNIALTNNVPNIYVLFEDVENDESVENFKNILSDKAKRFTFKDIKEMKFYIAKMIEKQLNNIINITVKEDKLYINNEIIKW